VHDRRPAAAGRFGRVRVGFYTPSARGFYN
jgi:hypothetical protein